jgi:hypothetical protein
MGKVKKACYFIIAITYCTHQSSFIFTLSLNRDDFYTESDSNYSLEIALTIVKDNI